MLPLEGMRGLSRVWEVEGLGFCSQSGLGEGRVHPRWVPDVALGCREGDAAAQGRAQWAELILVVFGEELCGGHR